MKKILTVLAGVLALAATSCVKQELAVFDASKATAPVLSGYEVTDDGVTATYTPAVLNHAFNKQMAMNHWLLLTSVNGNEVCEPLTTSVKEGTLTVTTANLTKKLMSMGYEEGAKVALEIVIRASMQEQARDNGRNGYVDSDGKIVIDEYEVFLPSGDPYARYTEKSEWGLVGSFNGWGSDPDVEMWTNGTLHVAKGVTLAAGDEVKFRKNAGWDENFGYAEGVDSYTLGEDFDVAANGGNIVIAEDGRYDLFLDPVAGTARIIVSVAGQEDPYAAYTETSPWSVIGSFNSWGGDVEMVTNGTLHVCKNITLAAGDEFKFRKDAGWDVNFGYAEGVDSYTLGEEFAVAQNGGNIVVAEDGVYDLILDPENATATVIKSVAPDAGNTPEPKPKPKAWSIVGTLEDSEWSTDFDLENVTGDVWTIKNVFVREKDEFKIRADHDWAKSCGGPEENAESTFEEGNPYGVYQPEIGKTFAAGDKNIRIGVEGNYNITLTYGDEPTILIEEYREFPEHLYMIGAEFGDWQWASDGVVEMTPVLHNPDWGANAEGQFYTVRFISAGKGFKFNSKRDWGGDFYGLTTNDGYEVSDNNCVVAEDGFYLVHIDLKNEKVHVEPARVFGIGDAFGSWDEEKAENQFQADGKTLKLTVTKAANLRMYVASTISTSGWWTREFDIFDGQIVPRLMEELSPVPVLAGQVVTLDFNAGTGTITGEGEAPAYKTEISVPGAYSGSVWNLDTAPKLLGKGDGEFKGALVMYKQGDAAVEFKFGHDGAWIGGTADGLNYTLGAGDNMTIDEGTYFWTVNLASKTATALKVEKVGLIGSFNEWSDDVVLTFNAEDHTYNGTVTLGENAELKVRFNGNWDYSLGGDLNRLQAVNDNCKVAEAGTYTAKLDLNKGTLTLTK